MLTKNLKYISAALLLAIFLPSYADDTELYDNLHACAAEPQEKYRFVFIVDNSGSMSSWEFTQSRSTVNQTITEVLNSGLDDIKVAVVQYGTNHYSKEHKYDVTVPFTSDVSVATDWNREFGPGSSNYYDLQDHQPASLARMRKDNVYAAGGALDVSDATNVQFVFFTDALRDYYYGCCSSLVSTGSPYHNLGDTLPGFGEYDALKDGSVLPNGLKAQFTILHVPPGGSWYEAASQAAAAIASPGGSYTGDVEWNDDDPEGPGEKPRRYVQGTFGVDDASKILELIEQVIVEVQETTYTNVAPAVSVNSFNELQHRDELYFSVFQPKIRPQWGGNIKKFRISSDGVLLDATETPAIDPETGSIIETARSYWSDSEDGSNVDQGGYREQLTASRKIFTDPTALDTSSDELVELSTDSEVDLELMDLAQTTDQDLCVVTADKENGFLTATVEGALPETSLAVSGGNVRLSLLASEDINAELRLFEEDEDVASSVACKETYLGGEDVHVCEASVDAEYISMDLYIEAADAESTVEYVIEYNIPDGNDETSCQSIEDERETLLSWLLGEDVYNTDGDDSYSDPHRFAADPLHSKPFLITYSGTSEEDAEEVLFFTDNLGLLHAVDPRDNYGTTLWSYMPEEHLDNVKRYANNKAGLPKVYGLDGPMSVIQRKADDSTHNDLNIKEVNLLISERRGGRNFYSLDVSGGTDITTRPSVNWKIKGGIDSGFSDLGQTWSELLPRKVAANCTSIGVGCSEHEVLLFSGGYDEAYDESGDLPDGALGNALYMVDVATGGKKFFWSAGNNDDNRNIDQHDLNLGTDHAIVATPTSIDADGDGAMDIIFAVDISGGVWRIDLDSTKSVSDSGFAKGGKIAQLSPVGDKRRFYNALDISRSSPYSGKDVYYLVTGSGYRAHPNETRDTPDRLYLLMDPFTGIRQLTDEEESKRYLYVKSERIIKETDLVEYNKEAAESDFGYMRTMTGKGEKILQSAVTFNSTIMVSSFLPAENGAETCEIGSGRAYFLNLDNLASTFKNDYVNLIHAGMPPEATILQLPEINVCIGTECAAALPVSAGGGSGEDSEPEDPCDPENFTADSYGSELSAAASASTCGLKKGRAYRTEWIEY
ncbi:MAG: hypothetical protein KTR33_04325 [Gammaproteobacteria bacterium]|nr:hypothetical protein [Gammaproteobacteria bacterium]